MRRDYRDIQPRLGRAENLELAFESRELRTICESEAEMKSIFPPNVCEALKRRLSDMRAASSINDLLIGHVRSVDATRDEQMVLDLVDNFRLVFVPNHVKNPTTADGAIEWTSVRRIKILRIEGGNGD